MNYRVLLNLLTLPKIVSSILMLWLVADISAVAHAVPTTSASTGASCDIIPSAEIQSLLHQNHKTGILLASAIQTNNETPLWEFTEAESDAAVNLFGCDCLSCISALRRLQKNTLNAGEGHCFSAMEQRVSPQQVQEVLQTLEAENIQLGK